MSPKERIEALLKAPPDGWVAFSEDESRVVAYGNSYDDVVDAAERGGVTDPILVKVPHDWTQLVLVG